MAVINIHAGDTHKLKYTTKRRDGTVVDITGAAITYKVAPEPNGTAIFNKSVGSGITLIDAVNGRFDIDVAPADTTSLRGKYAYQTRMTIGASQQMTDIGDYDIKPVIT